MTEIKLSHATPIFACADVETALAFCSERLGFERDWVWGDPPSDGGARRDEFSGIYSHSPGRRCSCPGSVLDQGRANTDSN